MLARFINPHLNKLQEDFVYTNVGGGGGGDQDRCRCETRVACIKAAYMTHAEALIHADLHTGSIMLNETDTLVIDPEFCSFGPMVYDVGAVLQNLVWRTKLAALDTDVYVV